MTTPGRVVLLRTVKEAQFRAQVYAWAQRRGWLVYWTWSSRHSPSGFPDLVMVRPPRLIFAELKAQGAPGPTTEQQRWLGALERVPWCEVHLWRPLDETAILKALQ